MLPLMAGKAPRSCGQFDAGAHGVIADEFHHLGGEFLAFRRAVADAGVVHQVSQAHDAQADAAGALGGFLELRDGGHVLVGVDDIIQEAGGQIDVARAACPNPRCLRGQCAASRLIEPRQQFSYGPSHCSPQGLVASSW